MDNIEQDSISREEWIILQEFFHLLNDVGYGWAYDIGSSEKDCVSCFYKKDGSWHKHYTEDGQYFDVNYGDKSIYDICLEKLKDFGNSNIGHYLVANYKKDLERDLSKERSK